MWKVSQGKLSHWKKKKKADLEKKNQNNFYEPVWFNKAFQPEIIRKNCSTSSEDLDTLSWYYFYSCETAKLEFNEMNFWILSKQKDFHLIKITLVNPSFIF